MKESGSDRSDEALQRASFETFFRGHVDAVRAYALRRSDADTAQEVVAETFTVAWRRFDDVPELALPWLLGVARRVLANSRRSSSRQQALALRLIGQPSAATSDPAGEVDMRLTARAALEQLPPAEREAIELLAWEGLTSAEAATVLGCSRRVFAVRVHRGRKRLRRSLSDAIGELDPRGLAPAPISADVAPPSTTQEAKRT